MRGQDHNATLLQYSYTLPLWPGRLRHARGRLWRAMYSEPVSRGEQIPILVHRRIAYRFVQAHSSIQLVCVCACGFRVTVIGSSEPFGRWCPHSQLASGFSWKALSYLYSPRVQLANVVCAVPHLGRMKRCGKCATLTWSYYVKKCLGTHSTNSSTRSSLRATVTENAVKGAIAETEASALSRFVLGSGFGFVFASE